MWARTTMAAITLCACGSSSSQPPAPDAYVCWPVDGTTPGGSVELGSGNMQWSPMPGQIQFSVGSQDAAYLYIDVRMQGLAEGDPTNFLDPHNPRTKITAKLVDGTTVGGDCPYTIGYSDGGDGFMYWPQGQMLVFLPFSVEQAANNTDVMITVEMIDSARHYASDTKTVHVTPRPM